MEDSEDGFQKKYHNMNSMTKYKETKTRMTEEIGFTVKEKDMGQKTVRVKIK